MYYSRQPLSLRRDPTSAGTPEEHTLLVCLNIASSISRLRNFSYGSFSRTYTERSRWAAASPARRAINFVQGMHPPFVGTLFI